MGQVTQVLALFLLLGSLSAGLGVGCVLLGWAAVVGYKKLMARSGGNGPSAPSERTRTPTGYQRDQDTTVLPRLPSRRHYYR